MAPTCGALERVNGTAVPKGITFRPFSTNFDGYKFGRAGGKALQRVVTRLKDHGSMPSPPVQTDFRKAPAIANLDRGILSADLGQISHRPARRDLDSVQFQLLAN
jgi:hypothetical protein